jgi:hypothetical protein
VSKDELIGPIWPNVSSTTTRSARCVSDVRQAVRDETQQIDQDVRGAATSSAPYRGNGWTVAGAWVPPTRRPVHAGDPLRLTMAASASGRSGLWYVGGVHCCCWSHRVVNRALALIDRSALPTSRRSRPAVQN